MKDEGRRRLAAQREPPGGRNLRPLRLSPISLPLPKRTAVDARRRIA
jgi:hypothetical protein